MAKIEYDKTELNTMIASLEGKVSIELAKSLAGIVHSTDRKLDANNVPYKGMFNTEAHSIFNVINPPDTGSSKEYRIARAAVAAKMAESKGWIVISGRKSDTVFDAKSKQMKMIVGYTKYYRPDEYKREAVSFDQSRYALALANFK
jgi:hypothetical protein